MVLANTLGDSPRNYGNRPVNTPNLFVEFTNLLIVFSNSLISFELEPRKFNSSNKSDYQKSVLRCLYIYQTYTN